MPPAVTGSGLSLFVTMRSGPATIVLADALLFAVFASVEDDVADAVLVIVVPTGALEATTMVNVAVDPAPTVAAVHEMTPVPPTAGFVHVNGGPLVCASDTNVVPTGTASVRVTPVASADPPFDTVTV